MHLRTIDTAQLVTTALFWNDAGFQGYKMYAKTMVIHGRFLKILAKVQSNDFHWNMCLAP